ncbi:unnamed protein product [Pedinophyceae sp. YPF-701]|nr:unnamed protein product [Pedinophyceae sp. YPF-701]
MWRAAAHPAPASAPPSAGPPVKSHRCHLASRRPRTFRVRAEEEDRPGASAPKSDASAAQFNPSDPVETVAWGGKLPSGRRVLLGSLAGATIALGGDLGGVTRALFSAAPDVARALQLDVVYPIRGFKRCLDTSTGVEYLYPGDWIADTVLARVNARRSELKRSLDPLTSDQEQYVKSRQGRVAPQTGFKPPVANGGENVSVIAAPIQAGFSLPAMGQPAEAATLLLDTYMAKGLEHELLDSGQYNDDAGILYYWFEYRVVTTEWRRRSLAVIAARGNTVYTLVALCPEDTWEREAPLLRRSAFSMRVLPLVPGPPGVGGGYDTGGASWDDLFNGQNRAMRAA